MGNPPAVPQIFFLWLFFIGSKTKIAIDFHNFGFSILGYKLERASYVYGEERHKLVRLLKVLEQNLARLFCNVGFTVTEAMQKTLVQEWGIHESRLSVLHDKAKQPLEAISSPAKYIAELQKRGFLDTLQKDVGLGAVELAGGCMPDNVRTLVSCTSWSPDEDFSDLFDALPDIATRIDGKLIIFITGRGELREQFETKYQSMRPALLGKVAVFFLWLPFADYPKLLQACDFGLSMHHSTSGVDLPMKVVDMFGFGGMPVLAKNFKAMPELVQDGCTGFLFKSGDELKELIVKNVCNGFDESQHKTMRASIHEGFRKETWEAAWDHILWPVFTASSDRATGNKDA